ncbi:MAG: hypothetical protein WD381_02120, partial [Balneolaceae bacterium]
VAVTLGSILLIHKAMPLHPATWALLPIHYEMAIWGWLVQFVMGTAYWMFPRYLFDKGRGSERMAWAVVIVLNFGIWLLIMSVFLESVALAGRTSILISAFLFAGLMWKRVVSYRTHS